jgi:membrane protein YqaA with SNARE-associated domain
MDAAHVHLISNHLPIVGLLIGTLVLILALFLQKKDVKLTALGILIFSALGSIVAFYSGEGAEEVVENMAGVSETLMHTHEELAETFFAITLFMGGLALLSFLAEWKNLAWAKYLLILTVVVSLADSIFAKFVGTSGGEIRHSEIRSGVKMVQLDQDSDDD